MKRSLALAAVAPCLAFAAVVFAPSEARAGITLHVDQDFGVLLSHYKGFGGGFDGRVGYRFNLGPVWLAPELGGGYMTFGKVTDDISVGGPYPLHPARIFGGGRFGLGGFFQPQVYLHAGYGWLGGLDNFDRKGPMIEGGGALDFVVVSILDLGVHAGYTSNGSGRDVPANWVNFGAHIGLVF